MRFEHLIEVNAPVVNLELMVPTFTREQLWRGLMLRVQQPQRFPAAPSPATGAKPSPAPMPAPWCSARTRSTMWW